MDLGWNPAAIPAAPDLLLRVQELREQVATTQARLLAGWRPSLELRAFLASAANLAAYIALRRLDPSDLEQRLAALGLLAPGRSVRHVRATLDALTHALMLMQGQLVKPADIARVARSMARDRTLLYRNTNRLLGMPPGNRWTRFMATAPLEAAADYGFVRALMERGMDCVRVSCARDDAAVWRDIIGNVRQAEKELGRSCKVLLDLAGPRLRTGPLEAGPAVLRVKVASDPFGDPLQPAVLVLDGSGRAGADATVDQTGRRIPPRLAVDRKWLAKLEPGDRVLFRDLKGRKRTLVVGARLSDHEVATTCHDGAYIARGTELEHEPQGRRKGGKTRTGALLAPAVEIDVKPGDLLLLARDGAAGAPERRDKRGRVVEPARIACSEPAVFRFLEPGHTVWLDDGRIGGLIEKVDKHGARLRITRARPEGERVAADRSIHLPDARVDLPALAERDLAQLDFACRHADLIGLSCVRGAEDIDHLADALRERNGRHLGIVAWIETRQAVLNLPDIVAHGAGRHAFGVVIARSALAVELGYEQLPEVEQQILRLCEAAHVPVIWSTRLLASLTRRDLPFRTEIADAAMSARAECVLLTDGPYTLQALTQLAAVLARAQATALGDAARTHAVQW
jgi:pyruvate kinase